MPLVLGGDGERVGRDVACYGRLGESLNVTNGEWTLFIWPQPEHFALLALATAAPVRALQTERLFREERPFPRFVRQRGNENPAVQGEQRPQQLGDRAPDNPEIVATLKRQAADFLRSVGAPTGLCVSVS
jgi:hypothetical protein